MFVRLGLKNKSSTLKRLPEYIKAFDVLELSALDSWKVIFIDSWNGWKAWDGLNFTLKSSFFAELSCNLILFSLYTNTGMVISIQLPVPHNDDGLEIIWSDGYTRAQAIEGLRGKNKFEFVY